MKRHLFTEVIPYGEHEYEYWIDDETGCPYVAERVYRIIFHGAGDHIGEPGPLERETIHTTTFAKLREAAKRSGEAAFGDIDETNWRNL